MKVECLQEEMLADYLEGRLSDKERDMVELHISDCDDCLGVIVTAHKLIEENDSFGVMTVPVSVTKSARDLVMGKNVSFIMRLKQKLTDFVERLKENISEMGMVLWTEWQLAPIRSAKVVMAKNQSHRKKNFQEIETDIEIEKIGDNRAQIRVVVTKDNGIGQNVRVTLMKRKMESTSMLDREIASYIMENNYVLFENIPFDHYKLTYTRDGVTVGRYLFQIK